MAERSANITPQLEIVSVVGVHSILDCIVPRDPVPSCLGGRSHNQLVDSSKKAVEKKTKAKRPKGQQSIFAVSLST